MTIDSNHEIQAGPARTSTLRQRILAFVCALVVISLLGSTLSLYRITEVNTVLDAINRVSVPLGRLFTQIQSDADIYRRELDRSLGQSHWKDPHWRPRPIPKWIEDVLESETDRIAEMIRMNIETEWTSPEAHARWKEWSDGITSGLKNLKAEAARLNVALEQHDEPAASELYPKWSSDIEQWRRDLTWGASEYERSFRQTFSLAQSRVAELRTGLELILIVVVGMSLLLLWLGDRALRPLGELTVLAREITRRGLRKEDKARLPDISISRTDEVSQLAREFHRMATALLEREKTVESQKHRVQEQNRLLREMGELNENILLSIESILIVTDLDGRISQCNPVAARWLGGAGGPGEAVRAGPIVMDKVIGTRLDVWPKLEKFLPALRGTGARARRVDPATVDGRVYGGHLMPLRQESDTAGSPDGAILVLEDLTDDLDIQERLRRAENLAAVGRMSAQVAHEVRNPLHSIGLEAEMALERATKLGDLSQREALKQGLQSILSGVDRLEKITENYLKLSRLSAGEKAEVDIGDVLETVLATYAATCESQGVQVDWRREGSVPLRIQGDRDLLEQVLGNLMTNSIQALETARVQGSDLAPPRVNWALGTAESGRVWLRIEDNGPGIALEVRSRLFTPFVTTRAQGTGLGLSFIKKVLEDHGGTIVCQERPPGQGACFEITLPSSTLERPAHRPALSEEGSLHAH